MAERWLQERESRREALYQQAQRSGRQADITEWERYVRQTARMQSLASLLESRLPAPFATTTGRRVLHKGQEIYLEHLVIGPSGIFLIESAEASPAWRNDLARSIGFFLANLGPEGRRFTCLVIARDQEGLDRLPPGVQLVESIEAALHLVTAEPLLDPLPPAIAQEMWRVLQLMESKETIGDEQSAQRRLPTWQQLKNRLTLIEGSYLKRATWREAVTLGATVLFFTLIMARTPLGYQFGNWLLGFFLFVPFALFWIAMVLLIPWGTFRKVCSYILMFIVLLFTVTLVVVTLVEREMEEKPGANQTVLARS